MVSDSFLRLPANVRQFVLDELDREIAQGEQLIHVAKVDDSVSPDKIRQTADGVARTLALRALFTGERLQ